MSRYLLMLGSNLASDARLRQALQALQGLGSSLALTAPVRTVADGGDGEYFNALATLDYTRGPERLKAELGQLETMLGRVRHASGVVAIDIDILASAHGGAWRAEPSALAKGEFSLPHVRTLLEVAGIDIDIDMGNC